MPDLHLGRKVELDVRDENFPARMLVPTTMMSGYRYWSDPHWNDQDGHGTCVGHNSLNWFEDAPVTHPEVEYDPIEYYRAVCLRDPWPENDAPTEANLDYGTTVHASAKEMKARGMIPGDYVWGTDLVTIVNWILTRGPVLVGTTWWNSMFDCVIEPSTDGEKRTTCKIVESSGVAGGHCYIWNGVNTKAKVIRIKLGSWNRSSWGEAGRAVISFDTAQKLISDRAECMMSADQKVTIPGTVR